MKKAKIKVGFAIDEEIIKELDFMVEFSRPPGQPIRAGGRHTRGLLQEPRELMEKARKLLIMRRKGLIEEEPSS